MYLREIQGLKARSSDPGVEVAMAQGHRHKRVILHLPWRKHSVRSGYCDVLQRVLICTAWLSSFSKLSLMLHQCF